MYRAYVCGGGSAPPRPQDNDHTDQRVEVERFIEKYRRVIIKNLTEVQGVL
ncbi:MAG: hypothetical protein ABI045_06300 [Flavobacteriales bacterium]